MDGMRGAVFAHYWKTATMAATSYSGDSPLFLVEYLLRVARVVVLLSIWRTILTGHGPVSGFTLASVLTYTLIAEVFAEQVTVRTRLDEALWEGSIATRMLQPMSMVGQFASDMCGQWSVGLCLFSLPLLVLAPLFGVDARPASPQAGGLFVLSLLLAVSVGLAVEFIFGGMVVALQENVWVISRVRNAVVTLLSGSLLPLALLPWGLGGVFAWLPFASMASAPLQIYTGTGEAARLLLVQVGWSLMLWPLARWLWVRHRERLVGYGG